MASQEPLLKTDGQATPGKKSRRSFLFQYSYADNEDVGDIVAVGGTSEPGQAALQKSTQQTKHTNISMFYGKDEYIEELRMADSKKAIAYSQKVARKENENGDISGAKAQQPDGAKAPSAGGGGGRGAQRSAKTGRMYPTPNKDEMLKHDSIQFLFTKMSNDNMLYLWEVYTLLFVTQCTWVILYPTVFLRFLPYWQATLLFGIPFAWLCIQNVYCLHDVIHGASFPPRDWQAFITHCWADQFSICWEDLVMEHMKHHSSTPDLLEHGEFGWDPASWLYVLQERWITLPLVPFWHFIGANDSGALFGLLWYSNFPDSFSQLYTKWFWQRLKHHIFLICLWGGVWMLGTYPMGRPLSEGWRVFLPVTLAARCGFALAWMVFTNFNHSHMWNAWLARAPERNYPVFCLFMSMILGGPARFNEMLFHDLHHGFPNAVGALSMRGRFNGWRVVHKAAMEALSYGIYKQEETDPETRMQKIQQRRSQAFKASNKAI
mmetsp:Transcript_66330/g.194093  ORF Transcript_66330/g.194093 Transcript_66330/m.194093 type:complete len:491 (-) Transcript_66330:361-1833(-)